MPRYKHGGAAGSGGSREYRSWVAMRRRSRDSSRGIGICERWSSFENFLSDMGPKPSLAHRLERKDIDGPYEPGNVGWATRAEKAANGRDNVLVTINGETLHMEEAI